MAPPTAIDIQAVLDTEGVIISDPLTLDGVAARRANAGKLAAGIAAFTSSDFFKSPSSGKPLAKRFDHLLSIEIKARNPSSLKQAAEYLKLPGIISLGGGLPLAANFPISELSVKVPTPPNFSEASTTTTGTVLTAGKYDVSRGKSVYDLSIALNYGLGTGSAQMLRWVTEHTEIICNPPYADWGCSLTVGSTSALDQAIRMFCERGDYILAEEYTFASAVETALPLGNKFLPIKLDSEGLIPSVLDSILSSWDVKARGARKPFLLYTIPTGQNPTGATQSATRRRKIYALAQKHDLYILEDEPYFFLQMQPYTGANSPSVPPPSSHSEFLKSLVPTYLSLDTDGRVMRMDSFSKVIAPGTRCGWITASNQIIERFVRSNEVGVQNPSGLTQMVLFKMLDEHWGHSGYMDWLISLRMEYTTRRDILLNACEKHLPREVVSWDPPAAGMFLWLKLDFTKHPSYPKLSLLEIEDAIFLIAVSRGVLVSKGSWFLSDRSGVVPEEMFFRATFAAASEEGMGEATERLGVAFREAFELK